MSVLTNITLSSEKDEDICKTLQDSVRRNVRPPTKHMATQTNYPIKTEKKLELTTTTAT